MTAAPPLPSPAEVLAIVGQFRELLEIEADARRRYGGFICFPPESRPDFALARAAVRNLPVLLDVAEAYASREQP